MHCSVASGYSAAKEAHLQRHIRLLLLLLLLLVNTFSSGASLEILATAHSGMTVYLQYEIDAGFGFQIVGGKWLTQKRWSSP